MIKSEDSKYFLVRDPRDGMKYRFDSALEAKAFETSLSVLSSGEGKYGNISRKKRKH